MKKSDRLVWINLVSRAIGTVAQMHQLTKIASFSSAIGLMASMSSEYIQSNKAEFDQIEKEAIEIINEMNKRTNPQS